MPSVLLVSATVALTPSFELAAIVVPDLSREPSLMVLSPTVLLVSAELKTAFPPSIVSAAIFVPPLRTEPTAISLSPIVEEVSLILTSAPISEFAARVLPAITTDPSVKVESAVVLSTVFLIWEPSIS